MNKTNDVLRARVHIPALSSVKETARIWQPKNSCDACDNIATLAQIVALQEQMTAATMRTTTPAIITDTMATAMLTKQSGIKNTVAKAATPKTGLTTTPAAAVMTTTVTVITTLTSSTAIITATITTLLM